jgi:hypothetical protein
MSTCRERVLCGELESVSLLDCPVISPCLRCFVRVDGSRLEYMKKAWFEYGELELVSLPNCPGVWNNGVLTQYPDEYKS